MADLEFLFRGKKNRCKRRGKKTDVKIRVKCLVGPCGFQKLQTWFQWFNNYTRGTKTCQKCTRLVPSPNIS
ncbi:hypothetical protein Hanom_Chr15g01368731 [Helianthus anomalus]